LHIEGIFNDLVTDNEGYADLWDQLDFPESPLPFVDDNYELHNDNEADDCNNEANDVDDNGSPGLLSGKKSPRCDGELCSPHLQERHSHRGTRLD
jgi:hypothetical protein